METVASGTLARLLGERPSSLARSFLLTCAYSFCDIVRIGLVTPGLINEIKQSGLLLAIHHYQDNVLELLLDKDSDLEIDENTLKEMAENVSGEALTWILVGAKLEITAEVVTAAKGRDAPIR